MKDLARQTEIVRETRIRETIESAKSQATDIRRECEKSTNKYLLVDNMVSYIGRVPHSEYKMLFWETVAGELGVELKYKQIYEDGDIWTRYYLSWGETPPELKEDLVSLVAFVSMVLLGVLFIYLCLKH